MKVEDVKPYAAAGDKSGQVRDMFDTIAPSYDFMNRAMTLGMDRAWRQKAVNLLGPSARYPRVLDIATGTADIPITLAATHSTPEICGIDLSEGMLAIGRQKVASARLPAGCTISLQQGDCLSLPYESESFDGVICAYGVRNFADIPAGLSEMQRVLRPGGRVVILELSTPSSPPVLPFYRLYTRCLIPIAGRLLSKDRRAYSYLPESIAAVPQGKAMTNLLIRAGFGEPRVESLCLGVCSIYTAQKP